MSVLQAGASASVSPNASPIARDAERSEDLYAVWKSVFERAHAVDMAHDNAPSLSGDSQAQLRDSHAVPDRHRVFTNTNDVSRDASDRHAGLSGSSSGVRATATSMTTRSFTKLPTLVVGATLATEAEAVPDSSVTRELGSGSNRRSAPELPELPELPEGETQVASDSVSVFVQGAEVTIVVRDVTMGEPDAVRCAFETAVNLTGMRAGLKHLTLNGRTIYQQQVEPPTSPTLLFAC